MGLIATYVVASAAEADRFDLLSGPGSDLQAVDGGVLMPDELDSLAEHFGCRRPSFVVVKNANESWLIRFDEELTRRLSGLPAAISDALADEHNLSLNEVDMLETVLRPLAAEAAAEPGKAVYEWISL